MDKLINNSTTEIILRRVEEDTRHNYQTYYEVGIYNQKGKWKIKNQIKTFQLQYSNDFKKQDWYEGFPIGTNMEKEFNSYQEIVDYFDKEVNKEIIKKNKLEVEISVPPSFVSGASQIKKNFIQEQKENQRTIDDTSIVLKREVVNTHNNDIYTFSLGLVVDESNLNQYFLDEAIVIQKLSGKNQEIETCGDLENDIQKSISLEEVKKYFDKQFNQELNIWQKEFEAIALEEQKEKQKSHLFKLKR